MRASETAMDRGEAPASSDSFATGACLPEPGPVRFRDVGRWRKDSEGLPRVKEVARVSSSADLDRQCPVISPVGLPSFPGSMF